MASYETLPVTEEQALQQPKESYKKIVAGVAFAAFVLGALSATVVKTSSHGNTALSSKTLVQIQLRGTNKCLDVYNDNAYDGAPVELRDCIDQEDGWTNKRWNIPVVDSQKPVIKYHSDNDDTVYCLDAYTGGAGGKSGQGLVIYTCGPDDFDNVWPDQHWYLEPKMDAGGWKNKIHIYPYAKNLCVDVPGGDTEDGKQLWTYECSDPNPNQEFVINS